MFFIFFIFLGISNPKCFAAGDFSGPVSSAMGGAGLAAAGPESHFLNPAGLPHVDSYEIGYLYRYDDQLSGGNRKDWSVLMVDSHEGVSMPASFSYLDSEGKASGQLFHSQEYRLSLGSMVIERLSFGLVGTHWSERAPHSADEQIIQVGAGMLFTPTDNVGLGAVALNLIDNHHEQVRPEMGLGFHYIYEKLFRLRLDGRYPTKFNPRQRGILAWGIESLFDPGFRFRAGSRWNDTENRAHWTAGVGFEGPRLALNYAYEQDFRENESFRQTFDLRLHF